MPVMQEPIEPLRDIMDRLGVDMSWYDKAAGVTSRSKTIPLHDENCSRLSIYLLKKDGSLWTVDGGEPYAQVRQLKGIPRDMYICAHCKGQFKTFGTALKHSEGKS